MTQEARAESADLRLTELTLPFGLVVDELLVTAGPVRLHLDPLEPVLNEPAGVCARISQQNVGEYLESLGIPSVRQIRVEATDGSLIIDAIAKVIMEIGVTAVCSLVVEGGTQLRVELETVSPPVARGLIEKQIEKSNPILDVSSLPVPVKILSVECKDGFVVLRGTASPPQSA